MAHPLPRASRWGWLSRPAVASRIEVCPPSPLQRPGSAWQQLLSWMMAPAPMNDTPTPHRLARVRTDFDAALSDIDGDRAAELRQRVQQALSLRELWHLRADVFGSVGLAHSQAEAELRLAALNRHFPTRTPRTPHAHGSAL